jgi:hypothetical protein
VEERDFDISHDFTTTDLHQTGGSIHQLGTHAPRHQHSHKKNYMGH